MDPNYPNYLPNTQYYGGFQNLLHSQSPNLNQMPSTPNHETSQHISRNLFEDSQIPSRSTEKNVKWETKEDIALKSLLLKNIFIIKHIVLYKILNN